MAIPIPDLSVTAASSFEALYRAEFPKLVRIATAMCGRRDIAEELVQDAMVKIYDRWPKYAKYDNPAALCRRIVINEAIGARRRKKWESAALQRRDNREAVALPPEADEFWSLVRNLPTRQMQVTILFYADDLAVADVAIVLEIAEGTVRATLTQARESLRQQLQGDAR